MKKFEDSKAKPIYLADLTAKQVKALPLLASGMTASNVSKRLKISQQQISNWKRDEKFQFAVDTVRRNALRDAETALSGLAMDAVQTLRESLNNGYSEQTRLRAAMYVIDRIGFSLNIESMGAQPTGTVNMNLLLTALGTSK